MFILREGKGWRSGAAGRRRSGGGTGILAKVATTPSCISWSRTMVETRSNPPSTLVARGRGDLPSAGQCLARPHRPPPPSLHAQPHHPRWTSIVTTLGRRCEKFFGGFLFSLASSLHCPNCKKQTLLSDVKAPKYQAGFVPDFKCIIKNILSLVPFTLGQWVTMPFHNFWMLDFQLKNGSLPKMVW